MDINEYYMELHVKHMLEEARSLASAEALGRQAAAASRAEVTRSAREVVVTLARALYAGVARWSSAASAGSKPTTARAWSRSR
jgi:lipid-binding SYLF domain-containing protein